MKSPGANVTVTTEVGYCPFCQRTRNLRKEVRHLGALVRTTVDCDSCHRTLSSTIGPPPPEPEKEEAAPEAPQPAAEDEKPAAARPAAKRTTAAKASPAKPKPAAAKKSAAARTKSSTAKKK